MRFLKASWTRKCIISPLVHTHVLLYFVPVPVKTKNDPAVNYEIWKILVFVSFYYRFGNVKLHVIAIIMNRDTLPSSNFRFPSFYILHKSLNVKNWQRMNVFSTCNLYYKSSSVWRSGSAKHDVTMVCSMSVP